MTALPYETIEAGRAAFVKSLAARWKSEAVTVPPAFKVGWAMTRDGRTALSFVEPQILAGDWGDVARVGVAVPAPIWEAARNLCVFPKLPFIVAVQAGWRSFYAKVEPSDFSPDREEEGFAYLSERRFRALSK